jgi:hypothetical protein
MLWLLDNDILWYIRVALDQTRPPLINFIKQYGNLSTAANFYYYVIMLLCLASSIILFKSRREKGILMPMIFILGMAFIHLLVEVAGRYRFPAVALFSLIAAYGLCFRKDGEEHMEDSDIRVRYSEVR